MMTATWKQRVGAVGFGLACASVLMLALSPLGYRLGWFELNVALLVLPLAGVALGVVALLVSAAAVFLTRRAGGRAGLAWALLGIGVSALAIGCPLRGALQARSVPRIHDITTDTRDPPQFVALAAVRRQAPNGGAYGGEAVAAEQRKAYPEVVPQTFALPPGDVFAHVESAARAAGWEIAAAVPAEGRLEATATTRLYGFKDDVVIRVVSAPGGSRVDIRSTSRVGVGDIGANAARIRSFVSDLRRRTGGS